MNFLPYVFVFGLLGGIVIDCVAMAAGAAAVSRHLRGNSSDSSSSNSGSDLDRIPKGYDQFVYAIKKNKLADAIMLLSQNGQLLNFKDPVDGKTPLIQAVLSNNAEMVQFLLQQNDIIKGLKDIQGRNALEWANLMNYKKIIKLLKGEKVSLSSWWSRRKKK